MLQSLQASVPGLNHPEDFSYSNLMFIFLAAVCAESIGLCLSAVSIQEESGSTFSVTAFG